MLPAWFYQTAASLGKTQELNRKPYNKQSARAVHPQGFSGKIPAGMLRKECCISSAWTANYCCLYILPESSGFAASLMQFMQFIPPLTSESAERDRPYKDIINIELPGSNWDFDKSLGGVQGNNYSRVKKKKKTTTTTKPGHLCRWLGQKYHLRICGILLHSKNEALT